MPETILFTTDRPDFYLIEQIYHPLNNPTGSVIPRPGSLVLDSANDGLLQRVISVHATTFTPEYGPVYTSLLQPNPIDPNPGDDNITSIIDYGNARFYLFYDTSETPTKLNIDKKFVILGGDAQTFEVVKYDVASQAYVPVSLYFDNGVYLGTHIPLEVISGTQIKTATNCHTSTVIQDEDVFYLFLYDYAGTQCGSVKLYAKRAVVNNTAEDKLIIEDFGVGATQLEAGELYLYPDQDPDSLVITPKLIYNNGTERDLLVDNLLCHLYGLEGFTAAYPGQEVELLIKYFLDPTQQAVGESLMISGHTRYLMKTIKLRVREPGTSAYNIKVLVVPRYITSTNRYILMFFLYNSASNTVRDISSLVTVTPAFDGLFMGQWQHLNLSFPIRTVYPDALSDFTYHQPFTVKVNPYSWYERYLIQDTVGDTYGVYGVDSPVLARPVIYYDDTLEQYFIPTSKFINTSALLEAFYYKARPLYDSHWLSAPPTPTHFGLRSVATGVLLTSAPIPVANYTQKFNISNVSQPNELVGKNVIVEWMIFESGSYKVIYGAPVDVYLAV